MTIGNPWDDLDPDLDDPYLLGRREDAELAARFGEFPAEHLGEVRNPHPGKPIGRPTQPEEEDPDEALGWEHALPDGRPDPAYYRITEAPQQGQGPYEIDEDQLLKEGNNAGTA